MDKRAIYTVPPASAERTRLRKLIRDFVDSQSLCPPLSINNLTTLSDQLIQEYALDPAIQGWIMVEINNSLWRETVASIPYNKRILLLPKCLNNSSQCKADIDELGLLCHRCNQCTIPDLQDKADALGMMSIVAEGFTTVIGLIENRIVDTVIGVSCLDSLERAFPLLVNHAVPGLAIPLNMAGCKDTEVDHAYVEQMMSMLSESEVHLLDYDHLKSTIKTWFSEENLNSLLTNADDRTSRIAREWLGGDGKRWRPYLLAAVYMALSGAKEIPKEVEWAAIAVECFHKASLVHDDIEDKDATRYGKQTIHTLHGDAMGINVGDLLLGYGYQLLARCGNIELVKIAAQAHADLCRGQGLELEWTAAPGALTTDFVLQVFRLKTVPAFDVSLIMGVICAGGDQALIDTLHRYADALGIAYQLFDDLEDGGMGTLIDHPRELAAQYHQQALDALQEVAQQELKRLLFRVTQKILK